MSPAGLLDAIGWDVQRAAATLLGPGDIEVGAVAAIRIAMTSAVGVAAAAGGLGQPTLDHDAGGAEELAEEHFLPTHIIMLGNRDVPVKKKSTLGHGIYNRKCENGGSERCILRRKVASLTNAGATAAGILYKIVHKRDDGTVECLHASTWAKK